MSTISTFEKLNLSRTARIRPKKASEYLGVSLRTLEDWRAKGRGPTFTKIVGKVYYEVADLDAFIESGRHAAPLVTPSEILHAGSNAKDEDAPGQPELQK
jgi:hypothetical protein